MSWVLCSKPLCEITSHVRYHPISFIRNCERALTEQPAENNFNGFVVLWYVQGISEKIGRLVLYVQNDLSFRVLSRWSTDRHVACTRPQPCNISHCSPLNRPQYAHYGKPLKITRRKSFELIAAMKSCGKRQENRLYYLKSSDKVKSKWQFGGRLRILFESIWLAENHSCCLYNYRG